MSGDDPEGDPLPKVDGDGDGDGLGLGAPPEPDLVARAVRRSKIAKSLFDADEQVRIGRYQLLERVGAGGLGVVWGAWDPELERRVAIKLLRPITGAPRDRIVREGQALAKLSHPHVVPIHDVGVHGEQVYLVMEWVRGQTLRAYAAEPRSVRELVEVYRAAAEGLAAAHDAGLIHRDFKPDNAIRGDDGRVRVLDFGLARGEPGDGSGDDGAAELTRGAGTPRYMAPEQTAGTALTAATDQYAFCVSLREALEGRDGGGPPAATPGWLDAILSRGTSHDPAARFASMHDLARALGRDPTTTRRRRLVISSFALLVILAFALGTWRASQDRVVTCGGGAAEIAKTWNPAARDRMVAHLRSLGSYGVEEADRLARELEGYAARWASDHRDACLAHERRELTDQVYERTLGCVARARVDYETIVEVLSTAPSERLSSAIVAARGLPAVERCAFEAAVSTVPPPPPELAARAAALANEIERARMLAKTDDPRGVETTKAATVAADALGYTPLIARAYLAHGLALIATHQSRAAIPVLDRAAVSAIEAFDDPTFVEAFARQVYAQSVSGELEGATPARGHHVEHVAIRAGPAGGFARALLFNNLGTARLTAGDPAGARAWFDRALAETTARGRDAELLVAFGNRALVTDDPVRRAQLFDAGRAALTELLGAHHRKTLDARFQAAFFVADPRRAATELRELCGLYERYHAAVAENTISNCRYELGWLAEEAGELAAARAAMSEVPEPDGPLRATADAYLLFLDGRLAEAAAAARATGAKFRDQSWAQFNAADAYLLAAASEARLGRRAAARADAREALGLLEQLTFLASMPNYQRRLGRTRALLARLAPPPEAGRFAREAAAWYRAAGYDEALARELDVIATGSR